MPSHRFGETRQRISVHEKPTKKSHATSKHYVDAELNRLAQAIKIEIDQRFKYQFEKLESAWKKDISIALADVRMRFKKPNSLIRRSSVAFEDPASEH